MVVKLSLGQRMDNVVMIMVSVSPTKAGVIHALWTTISLVPGRIFNTE